MKRVLVVGLGTLGRALLESRWLADHEVEAACEGMPTEEFSEVCKTTRSTLGAVVGDVSSSCECQSLCLGARPVSEALEKLPEQARLHTRYPNVRADLLALEQSAVALCADQYPKTCAGSEEPQLAPLIQ